MKEGFKQFMNLIWQIDNIYFKYSFNNCNYLSRFIITILALDRVLSLLWSLLFHLFVIFCLTGYALLPSQSNFNMAFHLNEQLQTLVYCHQIQRLRLSPKLMALTQKAGKAFYYKEVHMIKVWGSKFHRILMIFLIFFKFHIKELI